MAGVKFTRLMAAAAVVGVLIGAGCVIGSVVSGGGTQASAQTEQVVADVPPGTIVAFGGQTPPPGWLLADGSEVSRTQFPALYAAIGVTYGPGNGSTTFNLPDLRGRAPVDADGGANRLTGPNNTIGKSGGQDRHTLTESEMPVITVWNEEGSGTWVHLDYGANWFYNPRYGQIGGGQPHNVMDPYLVTNYIVKT